MSTERVALRAIALEVGGLTETISVKAEAPSVQTTTGERSALITQQQIEDIGLKGRDFMGVLKTLPGVVDTTGRDAPGWGTVRRALDQRPHSFNFSYDGVTNKDTGSNSGNYVGAGRSTRSARSACRRRTSRPSTAAVPARRSPSSPRAARAISTAAPPIYRRDDALNANEDRGARPARACRKPIYRYDNTAYTIGGPVLLPGTDFNRGRDKLFFFWSQDLLPRTDPGALQHAQHADRARAQG